MRASRAAPGVSPGAWSGGERPGNCGAMGLCCCKDWRGHLRAPKGNSGRARALRCSRRHSPRPGPHVLLLPAPARLCRGSQAPTLAGASPNSRTRGREPRVRAGQRSLGIWDGRWARAAGPSSLPLHRAEGSEEHGSGRPVPDEANPASAGYACAALPPGEGRAIHSLHPPLSQTWTKGA